MRVRISYIKSLVIVFFSTFSASSYSMESSINSILWENNTDQILSLEGGFFQHYQVPANTSITSYTEWSENPDKSSPFTKVFTITISGAGIYQAQIKFLRDDSQMQVLIDSPYTKSKNTFNIAGLGFFFLRITIDKSKKITIKLTTTNPFQEIPPLSFEEEEKQMQERMQKQLELMERERIKKEHERILKRPETEQELEKIFKLPLYKRK
jgi:hypothetical protein